MQISMPQPTVLGWPAAATGSGTDSGPRPPEADTPKEEVTLAGLGQELMDSVSAAANHALTTFQRRLPGYTGPADGLSHPDFKTQALIKPVNRFIMNSLFRVEVEGEENIPKDGKNLFCPTHPTVVDPPLIAAVLGQGDYRFVANIILFKGKGGPLITAMGAFPVDRDNPSRATIQHGVDLVKEGTPLVIFPEGGISENPNQINPLKRGAAYFAVHGQADRIVPIGIHYQKDHQPRPMAELKTYLIAGALVAGTLLGSTLGPGAQVVTGAMTGALTGAFALGNVARALVPQKKWFNPFPTKLAGLGGGLAGMLSGGLVGAFTAGGMDPGSVSAVVRTLAAGFCAQQMMEDFVHRDVARIKFGTPMQVEPYLNGDDHKAVKALTRDLHAELGQLKAELSGVPYDPHAPRIRPGTGIPKLPSTPVPLVFHSMPEEPMPARKSSGSGT